MNRTEPLSSVPSSRVVYVGATIFQRADRPPIERGAVIVEDGKVVWVGESAAVDQHAAGARRIDLAGMTMLPGLIDAHAHLSGLGDALASVTLVGTTSYEQVIERIAEKAATREPGEWITGRGWDQNDWPEHSFPTVAKLDARVPQQPVWVRRIDGHAGLANSAAMRAARVTRDTPDPEGGRIVRDEAGNPSGVFIDNAMDLIDRAIPPVTRTMRKARLRNAARVASSSGLTAIHDTGVDDETISLYQELAAEGHLPLRAYLMLSGSDGSLIDRWLARGPLINDHERLTVRSIKLYADGALGSRGAALLEPYDDDPGNLGLLVSQPEWIEKVSKRGREHGFQVNTHAIGDRGNRVALDAYQKAAVSAPDRFRIEHVQVIALEDIPRLARMGVIASMQPTHATSDMPWAEERIGADRIRGAYAWRKILDAGGRLALGSDFPVEEVNPFLGIYAAVTRQDLNGRPEGGWTPEERLTLAEAIRGFTADAAFAAFDESRTGTIEVGKLADFTVTEGNLFTTAPSDLFRTRVRLTIVGGNIVYSMETP